MKKVLLLFLIFIMVLAGYFLLTMPGVNPEDESISEPLSPTTDPPPQFRAESGEEINQERFEQEPLSLQVAYPPEGDPFYYYDENLFIFGTTSALTKAEVTVNGEPVDILDPLTGNFLTMAKITGGEETLFLIEARLGNEIMQLERSVLFPAWWQKMPPDPLQIGPRGMIPTERQVLQPGDFLLVAFQGSPGGEAYFRIGENSEWYPMTERQYPGGPPGAGGIYTAKIMVDQSLLSLVGSNLPLPIFVSLRQGEERVSRTLPGSLVLVDGPVYRYLEVKPEEELKNRGWLYHVDDDRYDLFGSTPGGAGYPTNAIRYLDSGSRYRAVGASGGYYRVLIGDSANYLINADAVTIVEAGETAEPHLNRISITENSKKVSLRLAADQPVPFKVDDGTDLLGVDLFGLAVIEDFQTPILPAGLKEVNLQSSSSAEDHVLELIIEPTDPITSFNVRWNGSTLLIDIFKPQPVSRVNPLEGKIIIIDPGHGGIDTGAPGPGEINEKDANLAMALYLADMLKLAGAEVILTRTEDEAVNLYDRPERIEQFNADLLISIHANAHAAGAMATEIRGLMILFNYAHNEQLADIMLKTMAEESSLPAFRTWRRNIAVLRHTHPPALLVEAGYMMHPYDNRHILQPAGQKELARAMLSGLVEYFLAAGN